MSSSTKKVSKSKKLVPAKVKSGVLDEQHVNEQLSLLRAQIDELSSRRIVEEPAKKTKDSEIAKLKAYVQGIQRMSMTNRNEVLKIIGSVEDTIEEDYKKIAVYDSFSEAAEKFVSAIGSFKDILKFGSKSEIEYLSTLWGTK